MALGLLGSGGHCPSAQVCNTWKEQPLIDGKEDTLAMETTLVMSMKEAGRQKEFRTSTLRSQKGFKGVLNTAEASPRGRGLQRPQAKGGGRISHHKLSPCGQPAASLDRSSVGGFQRRV